MNIKTPIIGIIVTVTLVGGIVLQQQSNPEKMEMVDEIVKEAVASSTLNDIYTWSKEERGTFLYSANEDGEYQVVVNATDDGIQNHRELVWDDVDFWLHRGVALYEIGRCNDALAAFYHASMRDPENDIANGFMQAIGQKHCKDATSATSL